MTSYGKYPKQLIRIPQQENIISVQYRQMLQQEAVLSNNVLALQKLAKKHHRALQDSKLISLDLDEPQRTEATWNPCNDATRPLTTAKHKQVLHDSTLRQVPKSCQLPRTAQQKSAFKSRAEPIKRPNDRLVRKSKAMRVPEHKHGVHNRVYFPSFVHVVVPPHMTTSQTPNQIYWTNYRLPKLPSCC
jgi:hypothetical protein